VLQGQVQRTTQLRFPFFFGYLFKRSLGIKGEELADSKGSA